MKYFSDSQTGQQYLLYADERKSLDGYYYTSLPSPAVLYCARSGRWFIWECASQSWRREQEYCRRYYENSDLFLRILPPVGLPSPAGAEQSEEEKLKEKLKVWNEQRGLTWEEQEKLACSYPRIVFYPDGGCAVSDDWTWDNLFGYTPFELRLDVENTQKLLSLFNMGTDNSMLTAGQKQDFMDKLERCKEVGESLDQLFDRLHIRYIE